MGGAIGLVVYCTHKRVCQTPQKACPQAWTSCAPALTGALMKSTQTGRNRFGRCPERTGQAETSQIPLIAMRPEISAASCGGTHPTTSILVPLTGHGNKLQEAPKNHRFLWPARHRHLTEYNDNTLCV